MAVQRVALFVEGADDEEAAALTQRLRRELLALDVGSVERAPGTAPPPGARGDALSWAQLIVELAGSLPALLALVRSWVRRNKSAALTIVIGEDRLELSAATADEQAELIAAWLARHDPKGTDGAAAERPPNRDQPV